MPRKQVARLRPKQSRAETANSVRVPRARLSPVLLFLRSLANLFVATSPYLPVKAIKPLPLARFGLFAYWRRQHANPPWRLSPPILSDPIRRSVEAGEPSTRRSPRNEFYRTAGESEWLLRRAKKRRLNAGGCSVFGMKRAAEDASNGTSSSSCLHDVNRVGLTEQLECRGNK